jgi:hypothetical protein
MLEPLASASYCFHSPLEGRSYLERVSSLKICKIDSNVSDFLSPYFSLDVVCLKSWVHTLFW